MWRAAVARPTSRYEDVKPAGEILTDLGDFWVANPWRYPPDQNLSAFEPNRVFLNLGGMRFLDVTWLSGAGWVGDGRGLHVADLDGDLQPDLIVRHVGGGAVRVYRNKFPRAHRLAVELRGTKSNRYGIGARVVAKAGGRTLAREVFPTNNHNCQQSTRATFGLGDTETVESLAVHWPSGTVQTFRNVRADQVIRITEGAEEFRIVR